MNSISASKDGHGLTMDVEVLSKAFSKLITVTFECLCLS